MEITQSCKKIAAEVSRVLIGVVFIFSGFVKIVDPWGYAYKIQDYLEAFGMSFFDILALPASFFISGLELVIGVCILLAVYRRFFTIILLLFMCFMTPLTLYLAIFNPVHDCGCFGDAIVITNWQTFFKNVVLLAAAIILFFWYKKIKLIYLSKRAHTCAVVVTWVVALGLSLYCYLYLPILDFRPYKIGNNISEQMEIPEGAPTDKYETTFIYAKDGVNQEFDINNYPKTDDWVFVDQIATLVEKGYEPAITDFQIADEEGDEVTDILLEEENYAFWLISWKLDKASDSNILKINELYDYCQLNGYPFYCLTASLPEDIDLWKRSTGAEYPFYSADPIMLKTMIRSNPGLMLVKEGTVINKWPNRSIPGDDMLDLSLEDSLLGDQPANRDWIKVLIPALILIILLLGVTGYDLYRRRRFIKRHVNTKEKETV